MAGDYGAFGAGGGGGDFIPPFGSLSHGERTKVLLALLFSGENDFLLVSHDRDLLDSCIDHVLVLNRKSIEVQRGNFSSWWENKRRQDAFAQAENEKHLRKLDMERVQFEKPMEEYSEGQKKKVLIAASLMSSVHLYIWDEPLNYIDVFSRMQIEELLSACRPTMLLVDHDQRFREKIATGTVFFR
ncbi:MAG: ATP-binding cassette domain-containing protein [Muribaculaceae bacterium]|nr:ATP-binding cassette domain-containing protein [Muribaculaceae bacterium]MCM1492834.1 ATP-binding cassette domain-containing protein [Muribaculaceae bacterium]